MIDMALLGPLGLAFLAWFLGGFFVRVTGMGGAIVALPLLLLHYDIAMSVALCTLVNVAINTYMVVRFHSALRWDDVIWVLVWMLVGGVLGVWMFGVANVGVLTLILAFMMLLSVALTALSSHIAGWRPGRGVMVTLSLLAGFTQGLVSAGGPWIGLYTVLEDWDKERIRAFLTFVFWPIVVVIAPFFWMHGHYANLDWVALAALLAGMTTGLFIGGLVDKKINPHLCHVLILCLSTIAGLSLLLKGLRLVFG